jgi:hypothetical protein
MKKIIALISILLTTSFTYSQYNPEWAKVFDAGSSTKIAVTFIATGQSGNSYICGYKDRGATEIDIFIVKYDSNGDTSWVKWYNNPFNLDDYPSGLVVNSHDEPIICGHSDTPTGADGLLVQLSTNGEILWTANCGGSADTLDDIKGIAIDRFDNIYVTGFSRKPYSDGCCFTAKYNSTGSPLWKSIYHYKWPYAQDYGFAICVDPTNQFCYTAALIEWGERIDSVNYSRTDVVAIKYGSGVGEPLWIKRYASIPTFFNNYGNIIGKIKVDNSGNSYIGTHTGDLPTDLRDFLLIKTAPNGDSLWMRTYSEVSNDGDWITDLKVDSDQNVYVTGISRAVKWSNSNWSTLKYNAAGDQVWARVYDFTKHNDNPVGLYFDKSGNIIVGGSASYQGSTGSDYALVCYNTEGDVIDTCIYHGTAQEVCKAMAMDTSGNVYLTGTWGGGWYFGTMKLMPKGTVGLEYANNVIPGEFGLLQNHPNPFTKTTTINWQAAKSGWQTLKVFDMIGNEVATLVDEIRPADKHSVDFNAVGLPAGVYFYQLQTDGKVETKKMIVSR